MRGGDIVLPPEGVARRVAPDGEIFDALCRRKVPMIRRTFPDPEPGFKVTITKRDRYFRANGKVIWHGLAKAILRSKP